MKISKTKSPENIFLRRRQPANLLIMICFLPFYPNDKNILIPGESVKFVICYVCRKFHQLGLIVTEENSFVEINITI